MIVKYLLIVGLALFTLSEARPKVKTLNLAGADSESQTKIREKRKYEIPILRTLEESDVEVKRETPREEPKKVAEDVAEEGEEDGEEEKSSKASEVPENPPEGGPRVKKQSPNNVCIKMGGCGKTVCGPVVSARGGPIVTDMRTMMQGGKPIMGLSDYHPPVISGMSEGSSKTDRFVPVQGRTVDTIVAPIALGSLGYGAPAAYSAPAPTVDLGHSFLRPPSVSTVPAVAVITAPHQPSHPLIHPWLLPHLMPHIMPHIMPSLMSNIGSFLLPHRLEPSRYPETEIKQPVPTFPPPSYSFGGDNTLVCQPFRNQRLEGPYDYFYKPDLGIDKSINVTDGSKKSRDGGDVDEERRISDHLRKVNEIKEEISQLNRAAQRIVDQQERLTEMQQKQTYGGLGQSSSNPSYHTTGQYMGNDYIAHPGIPWGYSRSNILSYPRSMEDIDFFFNLMRAAKKMGVMSEGVQPKVLSTIGDVLKGVQDDGKEQKSLQNGPVQLESDSKVGKLDKKSRK